ncbi:hypothetical protein FALBO_10580 [Fusarium albosuccineum]|uniref:Uncharacterized protein n=1 Tax=Fusarium albosuccineum TaxID=1237068 RepID=A0A8H4L6R1_9HYPO|nr:hypothetical protein FALBO_10580 [Fusarium albosuccineum]
MPAEFTSDMVLAALNGGVICAGGSANQSADRPRQEPPLEINKQEPCGSLDRFAWDPARLPQHRPVAQCIIDLLACSPACWHRPTVAAAAAAVASEHLQLSLTFLYHLFLAAA